MFGLETRICANESESTQIKQILFCSCGFVKIRVHSRFQSANHHARNRNPPGSKKGVCATVAGIQRPFV